ncbi:hypothetical protein [Sediminibacillus terrae]|uniref:hypothetical protein n=1 Tax=Sediminibacillus terrae TaxID=1562106 RepID=UPI001294EE83|nr:hypothetical protein [Sediminibacillus terrae]
MRKKILVILTKLDAVECGYKLSGVLPDNEQLFNRMKIGYNKSGNGKKLNRPQRALWSADKRFPQRDRLS